MDTYEQKYKEALERAKDVKNGPCPHDSSVATVEYIFPELHESENEKIRKEIIEVLRFVPSSVWEQAQTNYERCFTYLEKRKEQKLAEWSKEDEGMLKWIEDILLIADNDLSDKLNGRVSPITDSAYSSMKLCIAKCLSWLKSLRPQPNWKPSEEQMKALNAMNCYGELSYQGQQQLLIDLYQQLKKL